MADNPNHEMADIPSTIGQGSSRKLGTGTLALSEITASMASTEADTSSTPQIDKLMATGAMPTFKGQAQSVIEPNTSLPRNTPPSVPSLLATNRTRTDNLPFVDAIAYPESQFMEQDDAPIPLGRLVGDGYSTTQSASAGSTSKPPKGPAPTGNRRTIIVGLLILLGLLILVGTVVGGVCSLDGYCGQTDLSQSNTNEDIELNYFVDLVELQRAVDAYVEVWASSSGDEATVSTSTVALRYGYPMSTWNVDAMTNFSSLFDGKRNPNLVSTFNEDLSGWNVSRVTDMFRAFAKLSKYTGKGLEAWDVRKVVTVRSMFHEAIKFVGDVSQWDVSNIVSFTRLFSDCQDFNNDISTWDVRNAKDVDWMFFKCETFNQDLSGWDVSNVVGFSEMFQQAIAFNQNISGWDIGSGEDFQRMFEGAWAFNQDLSAWDVRGAKNTYQMFSDARSFNQSLCSWGGKLVAGTNVTGMFNATACLDESDPTPTNESNLAGGSLCHVCDLSV